MEFHPPFPVSGGGRQPHPLLWSFAAGRQQSAPFCRGQGLALAEGKLDYVRSSESDAPPMFAPGGDDEVDILKFDTGDGRPPGVMVRYSTHVNCCNRPEHYTGDFPFFLRRILERESGGIAVL
ncbi:MAG: hypothetical protein AB7F32_09430 [Victivallaceae bacterium]